MSKKRREFTEEFKAEVVALCLQGDRNASRVARDLGLTDSAVRRWVTQASGSQSTSSVPLQANEREELNRLRKENARLRMEREILKKAAAFFAKENA